MTKSNKEMTEQEFAIADNIRRAMHAINCGNSELAKKFLWRALSFVG